MQRPVRSTASPEGPASGHAAGPPSSGGGHTLPAPSSSNGLVVISKERSGLRAAERRPRTPVRRSGAGCVGAGFQGLGSTTRRPRPTARPGSRGETEVQGRHAPGPAPSTADGHGRGEDQVRA